VSYEGFEVELSLKSNHPCKTEPHKKTFLNDFCFKEKVPNSKGIRVALYLRAKLFGFGLLRNSPLNFQLIERNEMKQRASNRAGPRGRRAGARCLLPASGLTIFLLACCCFFAPFRPQLLFLYTPAFTRIPI
jgi:hypothetical protein